MIVIDIVLWAFAALVVVTIVAVMVMLINECIFPEVRKWKGDKKGD